MAKTKPTAPPPPPPPNPTYGTNPQTLQQLISNKDTSALNAVASGKDSNYVNSGASRPTTPIAPPAPTTSGNLSRPGGAEATTYYGNQVNNLGLTQNDTQKKDTANKIAGAASNALNTSFNDLNTKPSNTQLATNFITGQEIPIGPGGLGDYSQSNNIVRQQMGLPPIRTKNGIVEVFNKITGQWVPDPNGKAQGAVTPGIDPTAPRQLNPGESFNSETGIRGPQGQAIEGGEGYKGGYYSTDNTIRGGAVQQAPTTDPITSAISTRREDNPLGIERTTRNASIASDTTSEGPDPGKTDELTDSSLKNLPDITTPSTTEGGPAGTFTDQPEAEVFRPDASGSHFTQVINDAIKDIPGVKVTNQGKDGNYNPMITGNFTSKESAQEALDKILAANPNNTDLTKATIEIRPIGDGKWAIDFRKKTITPEGTTATQPDDPNSPVNKNVSQFDANNEAINKIISSLFPSIQEYITGRNNQFAAVDPYVRGLAQDVGTISDRDRADISAEQAAAERLGRQSIDQNYSDRGQKLFAEESASGFWSPEGSKVKHWNQLDYPRIQEMMNLQDVLASKGIERRTSLLNQKSDALRALTGIQGTSDYPGNVPKVQGLPQGEFANKIQPADLIALQKLHNDLKIAGQNNAAAIIQSVLDSFNSVTTPSGLGEALNFAGDVSGAAATVATGGKKPPVKL